MLNAGPIENRKMVNQPMWKSFKQSHILLTGTKAAPIWMFSSASHICFCMGYIQHIVLIGLFIRILPSGGGNWETAGCSWGTIHSRGNCSCCSNASLYTCSKSCAHRQSRKRPSWSVYKWDIGNPCPQPPCPTCQPQMHSLVTTRSQSEAPVSPLLLQMAPEVLLTPPCPGLPPWFSSSLYLIPLQLHSTQEPIRAM